MNKLQKATMIDNAAHEIIMLSKKSENGIGNRAEFSQELARKHVDKICQQYKLNAEFMRKLLQL